MFKSGKQACRDAILIAGLLAAALPAGAQEPSEDRWTATIAPYAWLTWLDGNVTVAGIKGDADAGFFDDILGDLSAAGMILSDFQRGSLAISANFVGARLESSNNNIDTTQDSVNFGFGVAYFVIDRPRTDSSIGYRLGPNVGARYTYLRAELDVDNGPTVDSSEHWLDPTIGFRGAVDFNERLAMSTEADIGGFGVGSDMAYNAQIFALYKTEFFGLDTSLSLGYRVLRQEYDHRRFEYNVTTHGPIIGAAFRF